MAMTFTGLKALGKAVRRNAPVDVQMPVEMQRALLRLAVGAEAEPPSGTPSLSAGQDAQEMTERADEDGSQTEEARLAG